MGFGLTCGIHSYVWPVIRPALWLLCLLTAMAGCAPERTEHPPVVNILQSGSLVLNLEEFNEELELKRSAYPYDIQDSPDEYNQMVMDLIRTLADEMRFQRLAADRQIEVPPEELAKAEAEFKKDYPEDSFNQLLLQNAVPYPLWKKRFQKKRLMDKVIRMELAEKIEISSSEIVDFYNQPANQRLNENELIEKLKQQKIQNQYDEWIRHLRELYPVEINTGVLKEKVLIGLTVKSRNRDNA